MSTINESIAKEIIDNDGWYPHDGEGPPDPQAYAVLTYENQWNGKIAWAVVYSALDLGRYDGLCNVQIKWHCDDRLCLKNAYCAPTVH